MIIDKYTKGMLTIIALALTILCMQNFNFIGNAIAAPSIQKFQICDSEGHCADITSSGSLQVNALPY